MCLTCLNGVFAPSLQAGYRETQGGERQHLPIAGRRQFGADRRAMCNCGSRLPGAAVQGGDAP